VTVAITALLVISSCRAPDFDVVIAGGTIYDGSGGPPIVADVGIAKGVIVSIGDLATATAFETIDAEGLVVAPGFIDAHSHAELDEEWGRDAEGFLTQGITTVALGLDGGGEFEVASVLERWDEHGIGVNALYFVGHNAVRREVMDMEARAPTEEELDRMRALVRQGMEQGAFGLSTGLFYTPGTFSETEEVVELARVAAEWDGAIYDTHDRDLGATYGGIGYDASVAEGIRIGEESGLRVIFSHFNPQGATNYGRADVGARMIDEARARGVEVWAAHHPYTATQSNLRSYALPRWATGGGTEAILARFAHPDTATILSEQIMESLAMRGGPQKIMIVDENPELNGRTLAALAEEWELTVPETVHRVVRDNGNASVMNLDLYDLENTRYLVRMPWLMTCTDGRTPAPGQQVTHPRASGAFPRKMRLFALDGDDIDVAFAIRSFSGLAADFFGLADRGYVAEGRRADIVVLDLDRYRDRATMEDPRLLSEGVVHVLVNGSFAIRDETPTRNLAGEALRAPWEHADGA
jgi:N-acyl-D-amino-acid deacylase